ncbi:MAG: response regulator transcription factor [Patescibacteria group bacterium]|nr:response regulator transcription factor [Patescibacteria group bacterium]
MRKWERWTAEEEDRLRALVAEGRSDREIAVTLGRTAYTVKEHRRRLGILRAEPAAPWDAERKAAMIALIREGLPYRVIGERFGIGRKKVADLAHLWGVTTRPANRRWTAEEDGEIEECVEKGWTPKRIGRRIKRTKGAVEDRIRALGLHVWEPGTYSLDGVGRLFGVNPGTVGTWVRRGALAATLRRSGKQTYHIITLEAIYDFAETEDCWVVFDPSRITDRALRLHAVEARQGLCFLSVAEVARHFAVVETVVTRWCREGRLRAIKHHGWWVRSDWLTLEPETRPTFERFTAEDEAFIREWWGIQPVSLLAEVLGRSAGSLYVKARRMGLPSPGFRRPAESGELEVAS